MIVASMRLRNSGLKARLSASSTAAWRRFLSSPGKSRRKPTGWSWSDDAPRLLVIMTRRVAEVHCPAVAVGEASVFEDLEQDVEHVGVGLLDFVEEDDAEGAAADGLG